MQYRPNTTCGEKWRVEAFFDLYLKAPCLLWEEIRLSAVRDEETRRLVEVCMTHKALGQVKELPQHRTCSDTCILYVVDLFRPR